MRTGSADLPLHGGKAPPWLFKRMVELGGRIAALIIEEYGHKELFRRLSNPFFFQAFGSVIGFDWHSSGLTTTTTGALAIYFSKHPEYDVYPAGGKGKSSISTPEHISSAPIKDSLRDQLIRESKLIAKVDNSLVQDGYSLYHHALFFTSNGNYVVIQQGINESEGYARRYHWLSGVDSFVNDPHSGIAGYYNPNTLNLVDSENSNVRSASLDLVKDGPNTIWRGLTELHSILSPQKSLLEYISPRVSSNHLFMKKDHYIRVGDLTSRDLEILNKAYEIQPQSYEELLMIRGMGAKKLRALALVADLIYGEEITWRDPVKYSFAHGGKDGIPYPVDKQLYDENIEFLDSVLEDKRARRKLISIREFIFSN